MLKPSEAGFRRLLPLLRPHLRQLVVGLICMLVYVSSFLLLLNLAGDLFPALGSRDLGRVLSLIGQGVLIFAVQKLAQFGQDSLLAGPARRQVTTPSSSGGSPRVSFSDLLEFSANTVLRFGGPKFTAR